MSRSIPPRICRKRRRVKDLSALELSAPLRSEGWPINRTRVRRLYRLEGLQMRMRVRRREHMALHRSPAPVPRGCHTRTHSTHAVESSWCGSLWFFYVECGE